MRRVLALGWLLACVTSCASEGVVRFELKSQPIDRETADSVRAYVAEAARGIEEFFGEPFPLSFEVDVPADRSSFDAAFPAEWGIAPTQCWMVAYGVAQRLEVLSPRVWREQACEHDPADIAHVHTLLAHELVHVFHGQHNESGDFSGVEGLDWFVEGLAVYASGQLEQTHIAPASEAIARGVEPKDLASAWSGKYRYGVCGSLVRHLDERVGRAVLVQMLSAKTSAELLALAGVSEEELLRNWRASVVAADSAHH
jgi:hypothetical protein